MLLLCMKLDSKYRIKILLRCMGMILRLLGTTSLVSQGGIFEQGQIARAAELGLGIKSPDQIQLVTGDPESEAFATQVRDILLKDQ